MSLFIIIKEKLISVQRERIKKSSVVSTHEKKRGEG